MPELPEVEIVRRGLEPVFKDNGIVECRINIPALRYPFGDDFCSVVSGNSVKAVGRRGKYMLIDLDDGHCLVWHLGMSGRVRIYKSDDNEKYVSQKHDHVVFEMRGGAVIVFYDPRRFGVMKLIKKSDLDEIAPFKAMGPEPLGNHLNGDALANALKNKKTNIKAALLDQNVVAGVGNIYACEALYMAGIHPATLAGSLKGSQIEALVRAVRAVLFKAIEAGGSTLKDYRQTDGSLGYFQHMFGVYDRAGQPCPDCECDMSVSGGVQRIVQNGRSTFYCPVRQN